MISFISIQGPCVADLGYKRIHIASARVLTSSVPVWCHQRPCDPDRIRVICDAFYRENDTTIPQLLGTVCIYALPVGGRVEVGLFDGQHRVQAMAMLLRRRQVRFESFILSSPVYPSSSFTF